jgi:hypothetical protein
MMVCRENGLFEPDVNKVLADIWPALHQDHGLIGVIGEHKDQLEGMVLLKIGSMWYSNEEIVEERTVFVHPKFRKARGGRAKKLCEFSKKVADELGLTLIIGILSNQRTESKTRLYNRVFGQPAGAFYLYGSKTGEWNHKPAAEIQPV